MAALAFFLLPVLLQQSPANASSISSFRKAVAIQGEILHLPHQVAIQAHTIVLALTLSIFCHPLSFGHGRSNVTA